MDFSKLDPDAFAKQGSYTTHITRDVHPKIDPSAPALTGWQSSLQVLVVGLAQQESHPLSQKLALVS